MSSTAPQSEPSRAETDIAGNVFGPVLSGVFHGPVNVGDIHIYPVVAPVRDRRDERDRRAMIAKQRLIWIEGVLTQSLWNEALITLDLAARPDAVRRPYGVASRLEGHPDVLLPSGTPILDIYDRQRGELLILGAPGSGKTTLLLELMRDLLTRAEQTSEHPIPVKFDLSAWGDDQPLLTAWLVQQLNTHYGVPTKTAERWVHDNVILPLLDGLDEVAAGRRAACVAAINHYRHEHGLSPTVVCCREQEYAELPSLHLNGAIVAQPLSDMQVQHYLDQGGPRLMGVRRLLTDDPSLIAEDVERGRLLATPLMLSIVTLTYADVSEIQLQGTTTAQRRAEVFDAYLRLALARKAPNTRYSATQTYTWLSWLAWQLRRAQRSTYFIEEMQPNWLRGPTAVDLVRWGPTAVFGVPAMLLGALGVGWFLRGSYYRLVAVVAGCVSIGLAFGLFLRLMTRTDVIQPIDQIRWSWSSVWQKSRSTLGVGVGIGLVFGVVFWLGFGLGIFAISYVERGQRVGPTTAVVIGLVVWLVVGLGVGLVGWLVGGFTEGSVGIYPRPNAGMRASLRNGVIYGLGGGLAIGLGVGLLFGLVGWAVFQVGDSLMSTLIGGLMLGVLFGLIVGLVVGLDYGLRAVIAHYSLRLLLILQRLFPLNITAFCDYCAERVILQRVGGGWTFIHRLLLEHLADAYEARRSLKNTSSGQA